MPRRRVIVAGVAAVAIVGVAAAVTIMTAIPSGTAAQRLPHDAGSTPSTAAGPSTTPKMSSTGVPTGTSGDAQVLNYVAGLPTVHDVTADTVGEFSDLVCTTLRSPKMSATFYQQVLAIEKQGYSLSDAQATGLLHTVSQADCPDALRVVESAGAQSAASSSSATPGR